MERSSRAHAARRVCARTPFVGDVHARSHTHRSGALVGLKDIRRPSMLYPFTVTATTRTLLLRLAGSDLRAIANACAHAACRARTTSTMHVVWSRRVRSCRALCVRVDSAALAYSASTPIAAQAHARLGEMSVARPCAAFPMHTARCGAPADGPTCPHMPIPRVRVRVCVHACQTAATTRMRSSRSWARSSPSSATLACRRTCASRAPARRTCMRAHRRRVLAACIAACGPPAAGATRAPTRARRRRVKRARRYIRAQRHTRTRDAVCAARHRVLFVLAARTACCLHRAQQRTCHVFMYVGVSTGSCVCVCVARACGRRA